MTDEDLAALRSRYLGVDKKKRKIRKMNERKFVFDWDEQEDTFSADPSANIGVQRQGAQVMFGRGHIAGMDDGGGGRTDSKSETQLADAMERRKAAKHGYDDRHWTDKPLDEMKERDWRIFREDFSIAARGLLISIIPLIVLLTPV
jgi:ATP-dependent RNA helicase DDX23/PRP28